MKKLSQYITEKFKISKDIKVVQGYNYHPKDKEALRKIIQKKIKTEGLEADLNDIDTSKITDMSYLFNILPNEQKFKLNINISEWDVSNVKDMSCMFVNCISFNCNISEWDVSNVEDMSSMFAYCSSFNCNISKWNTTNVKNMKNMFQGALLAKNPPAWYHE